MLLYVLISAPSRKSFRIIFSNGKKFTIDEAIRLMTDVIIEI
jgi:hypothetical protein